MVEWVFRYNRLPRRVCLDADTKFLGDFKALKAVFHFELDVAPTNAHWTRGPIERANGMVTESIKALCVAAREHASMDWDLHAQ